MPTGLKRYYGGRDLHFITCSCYQRRPGLGTQARRTQFLKILEQVRRAYDFTVIGYVAMPEHIHPLVSEPEKGDLSRVMQVLKQRMARQVLTDVRRHAGTGHGALWEDPSLGQSTEHFWQARYYDYNVWSDEKRVEKLRYIHRNPVKRGLVLEPQQWLWSSFRAYACGEPGLVMVNAAGSAKLKVREPAV